MLTIPFVPAIGAYDFTSRIGDDEYRFFVRWNATAQAWYFDVYDSEAEPIAHGLKIVLGAAIGKSVMHPLFRDGQIVAYDTTKQGREATFNDLGTRVVVVYWTASDLLALVTGGG